MADDLQRLFGGLAQAVLTITSTPDGAFLFSAETLPVPPADITTDRLYIETGIHEYGECFAVDMVTWYAHKETFRDLALLILATVFHPEPEQVRIHVTHPASQVTSVLVRCEGAAPDRWLGDYRTRPVSFRYAPEEVQRLPWYEQPLGPGELPCFCLRSDLSHSYPSYEQRRRERDIVAGFGTDRACVRLADALLNASRPESTLTELVLESEAGYRGVGRASAEACFEFPDSVIWYPSAWLAEHSPSNSEISRDGPAES